MNKNYTFITYTYLDEKWGGISITFMESNGHGMARLYTYDDDSTTFYIDWLSVSQEKRKEGLGTELQKVRESWGKLHKYTYSCLWVRKGTWMEKWYERRGYTYYNDREEDKDTIWMRKEL